MFHFFDLVDVWRHEKLNWWTCSEQSFYKYKKNPTEMSSTTKRRQFLAKQIFQFHMSPSVTPENAFNLWFPLNLAASSGKRMFCHCHHNQRSGYFKCMSVTWWYVNMLMVSFESCSIQWRKDVLSLPSQAWTSHPGQSYPLSPLCCTWVVFQLVRVTNIDRLIQTLWWGWLFSLSNLMRDLSVCPVIQRPPSDASGLTWD